MGLSSNRNRVSIGMVAQQFYDYEVFQNDEFYHIAYNFVTKKAELSKIEESLFKVELFALRIELFGLALWNNNLLISSKDEFRGNNSKLDLLWQEVCSEILFTKNYLEKGVKNNIWQMMGFYNQAIEQSDEISHIVNLSGLHPVVPIQIEVAVDEEERRKTYLHDRERSRASLSNDFKKLVPDLECITRLVNRGSSSDEKWRQGFISQALTNRLMERLGCSNSLDYEIVFRFQALIFGIYKGARDFVEIMPFTPEYQIKLKGLVQLVKKATQQNK